MKVFVTGATGLIGRAVVQRLLGLGHHVSALARDAEHARARLGPDVQLVSRDRMAGALKDADAVVNLAGEPVIGKRWNAAQKAALVSSRVDLTREIAGAMRAAKKPGILVSASAVGWYGDRADEELSEDSGPGHDFLADLCRQWEEAALAAQGPGLRVACLRIGIVLSTESGALANMLPAFRFGGGGPIGSGRQFYAWIHLEDVVGMILSALTDDRWSGAINATAPEPARQRDFAKALGRVLGRPAFVPAPAIALRVVLGEAGTVLTSSQRALPRKALSLGYAFRHPALEPALAALVHPDDGITMDNETGAAPKSAYLERWPAVHHLRQVIDVPAPVADVFRFFSHAANLGLLTPSWLSWRILGPVPDPLVEGATIDYAIRLGPIPMTWRTVIEGWVKGKFFCDAQHRGPYRTWWHEHRFEAHAGGTRVVDDVYYTVPLGPLGRLVHALFVGPTLRAIFGYRREAIGRLFPAAPARVGAAAGSRP